MKRTLLIVLTIVLAACTGVAPLTVTPQITVTPTSQSTGTPAFTATAALTPTTEPTGFTPETLAGMDDEAKIAAAPSINALTQSGQISAEIDPAKVKIKVEAGHVVTYTVDGKNVAAYDLRLGVTMDQMDYKEYGENIMRCFYDNNWDFDGYTPSLEERGMLMEQVCKMVEGSFAANWGFREGLFSRPRSNGGLEAPGWDLRTVANRNAFYDQVLLSKYRAAATNGTLFEGGSVIPLDNGVQITGQLPDVYVVFEYNAENSIMINSYTGKPDIDFQNYPWVNQEYDPAKNVLKVTIGVDEKLAKMMKVSMLGDIILGSLRDLSLDQITGPAQGDMSGMTLLDALGVSNLGSQQFSELINGDLNPDTTVKQGFDGLDPVMYNRK